MSKWQEKTKRPVLPVYMAALVWPIMALLVPIYTLGGLVLTAAVSAGAYFSGTKRSVDRFARYYLPEVVKLMGTYAALEQNGVRGENAAQIEAELRRNAETTATAFENQLDALYSAEAMDISTDIEVLDSILKSQNLAK